MQYAWRNYQPDAFIINLVYNDFDESLVNFKPVKYFKQYLLKSDLTLEETIPQVYYPSKIRRTLKHSAIFRFLFITLEINRYNFAKTYFVRKTIRP